MDFDAADGLRPDPEAQGLSDTIDGWLAARGRDVDLGDTGRPLPARDALDARIARVTAYSVPDLLNRVDEKTVRTPAGEVELRTRVATTQAEASERIVEILFEEPGLITRVLHAVATPSMIYFLLILGLAAIAFELTQPGFGFAGFSGITFVALAVYGLTVRSRHVGSQIGASATKQTPSAKSSARSFATRKARQVLPTPPGPVSVSRCVS